IAALGDYAFPSLAASPLPWLLTGNLRDRVEWRTQVQIAQDRPPLYQRQRHQVASVQPEDVEDVIPDIAAAPIDLTVQNDLIHRQSADHFGDGGIILRQLIAGEKLHAAAFAECEQPDPVELALEDPLGAGEALLGQRCGHRDDPFR